MLLAQLVVHTMRFLNFDEDDQPGYDGWNPAAIRYWRTEMGCRPAIADLKVPVLPDALTGTRPAPVFRTTEKTLLHAAEVEAAHRFGPARPSAGGAFFARRSVP